MPRNLRIALIAVAAAPVSLVLLVLALYSFDRFTSSGEVLRNVSVNEVELAGLDEDGVRRAIATLEQELSAEPALFTVDGTEFVLLPSEVGFTLDADGIVEEAMAKGREGGLIRQVGSWFGRLRGNEDNLELSISVDPARIDDVVSSWEQQALDSLVFEGSIEIVDGEVVAEYPRPGRAVDRDEAVRLVAETVSTLNRPRVDLPVGNVEPGLTAGDLDATVQEANLIIGAPVTLRRERPDISLLITQRQLTDALRIEFVRNSTLTIDLSLDQAVIDGILQPLRDELELPPQDASFRVNDDDTVTLIPGFSGTIIDGAAVTAELFEAAHRPTRVGDFPFAEGVEPEFTTEDAEAMMPIELVSDATTEHNCCEARVTNIQLFADIVDGDIVWPGETYSLNEAVGRRTRDKGFVAAPMIRQGELVPDVGGGVSQFATTFYNAVFFGGYEDITHKPHSIYISRYPEGREATISWPEPDLQFRNNTDAIVIIKTEYTDTSITVKFFGNNGGIVVEDGKSDRFRFTEARERYEADPGVEPGNQEIRQNGSGGFSVVVTRTITYPDGREPTVEEWTVRYVGAHRIIVSHPCEIPAGQAGHTGEECPVQIPPLGGLTVAEAQAAVEAAGLVFTIGVDEPVTIESGLDGLIASHTSGFAPLGSVVTVHIGVAPEPTEFVIPGVIGLDTPTAQGALVAAGFVPVVGDPIEVAADSPFIGLIAAQTQGSAPLGSTVVIRVGVAPPPPPSTTTTTTATP